jgi:hypothetical protein
MPLRNFDPPFILIEINEAPRWDRHLAKVVFVQGGANRVDFRNGEVR